MLLGTGIYISCMNWEVALCFGKFYTAAAGGVQLCAVCCLDLGLLAVKVLTLQQLVHVTRCTQTGGVQLQPSWGVLCFVRRSPGSVLDSAGTWRSLWLSLLLSELCTRQQLLVLSVPS